MSYTDFARYYDSLTTNVGYSQRADYILKVLEHMGHDPGTVLDLACGTGTLTLELKKRGIDIFGADASADMLTEAQQKAYEAGESIFFLRQKMQELELPGTVDTVICTLDCVNHITSPAVLGKAFERVCRYLTDDGIFIFDANTIYKHREILGQNCYIYETDEVFCAWQNEYCSEDNTVLITLDFFVRSPDGKSYIRSSEQLREKAYSREEMKELLDAAGLEAAAVFGDLTLEMPSENEQREIYVVRKKKI